ncbi:hypothetical protein P171DRAFT_484749 [Karstenula rhodostoma CBS 690.94]|uniref:Uncharacterized protein n=1 Tax=Karstenula rhodostoma CBS 690.94 TaxID=1392251 RepID=A0A9P4UAL7_9PLEO|nr:hypothetical protein P171DRAFT_484749 [Karstenula rhodostoma CBS 690.94]
MSANMSANMSQRQAILKRIKDQPAAPQVVSPVRQLSREALERHDNEETTTGSSNQQFVSWPQGLCDLLVYEILVSKAAGAKSGGKMNADEHRGSVNADLGLCLQRFSQGTCSNGDDCYWRYFPFNAHELAWIENAARNKQEAKRIETFIKNWNTVKDYKVAESKMSLLALPQEVLDLVFTAMVHNDICNSFPARAVCRLFKQKIEWELITNTPLEQMLLSLSMRLSCLMEFSPSLVAPHVWIAKEQNAYPFVEYRTKYRPGRPDSGKYFPIFIQIILNALLAFLPAQINLSELLDQYRTDLLRVIASKLCEWPHVGSVGDFERTVSEILNGNCENLLVAAAAVENIDALESLLDNPHMLLDECILGDVWHATVVGDKLKSLQFLLAQLERIIPISNRNQSFDYWPPLEFQKAVQTAISLGSVRTANALMEFLVKHDWLFVFDTYDVSYTIECAMAAGSIEIFEHAHCCIPNIDSLQNYKEYLWLGFASASREGHGNFIRYLLENDHVPHVRSTPEVVVIWDQFNGYDFYYVQNPLLEAAKYSRLSVLEAFVLHDSALINYPGLLEMAVLGSTEDPEDGSPWHYKHYDKKGSRHAAAHFLFSHGIAISGRTIQMTNYFAKMFLAQETVTGDFAMTLIILLINLRNRFDHKQLRKQLHVPVTKAMKRILDAQPEMRPLGIQDYDFVQMSEDLNAWLGNRG